MFQVDRPASNDCCSDFNRDTHWQRKCRIRQDNKHVYTTGKPDHFKGSQETLLRGNKKNSDLHCMANECMVNTGEVCCGIAGTMA